MALPGRKQQVAERVIVAQKLALLLAFFATGVEAACPALPLDLISTSMNLNGIVGDNSGASTTKCTNGKVLATNGGWCVALMHLYS